MSTIFNEQQKEFIHFLSLLHTHDLLSHMIITGSWAEYVYAQSGIIKDFSASLRTIDVDFLIRNIRRPITPISLSKLIEDQGYSLDQDVLLGTTKIFTPNGMEIEFLVPQKGKGDSPVIQTNFGIKAQALRHMDILIRNAISTEFLGMTVYVPRPEAYVLQKMIINKDRKASKQEKDANSVFNLLSYISAEEFQSIIKTLTKNEIKNIKLFWNRYPSLIAVLLPDNIRKQYEELIENA